MTTSNTPTPNTPTPNTPALKAQAADLLRRYDTMRKELRQLERELHATVTEYGKATGRWGFSKDMFRIQLEMEQGAERDNWEKHNG